MADTRIARSVGEGWDRLRRSIHAVALERRRELPPASAEAFMRDCYYAGAAVVFDLMTRSTEMEAPIGDDDAALRLLDRVDAELRAYANDLLRRVPVDGKAQ